MGFRSLDIFKKVNQDIDTSTATGGFYSIIALIAGIILFVNEFNEFNTVTTKTFMIISQTENELIKANIDITILGSPCYLLALDLQDDVGSHLADYTETIQKIRVINGVETNVQLGDNQPDYRQTEAEYKDVIEAIQNKEQCRFKGHVYLKKVPGNFHISFHSKMDIFNRLRSFNYEAFQDLNVNYIINHLAFGNEEPFFNFVSLFGNNTQVSPFDKMKFELQGKNDFDNYLKILPVQYHYNKKGMHTNQFKFSMYNSQHSRNSFEDTPALTFKYEISPINIVYNMQKQSVYHFIVQICAIIGGIFSVIGIFNSLTTGVIQQIKKQ